MKYLIDKLSKEHCLELEEYEQILDGCSKSDMEYLHQKAREAREPYYQNKIYIRGLIEFTNYCKNDCYYCGIRRSNTHAIRYRLTKEEILTCCQKGYRLGFRTFVLQGGEDPYYNCERMVNLISSIKDTYPDCAVTLSIGEKTYDEYRRYYEAGADRYLLRHETADEGHYSKLHPADQTLKNRLLCLQQLKEIGYQVGCGFMVGSPYQTNQCIAKDLVYIQQLRPDMVGIGPFIPHHDTPFADRPHGSIEQTLILISILRLIKPNLLLPATTALGTITPNGRELGIKAGANVVMPNLSPMDVRKKYLLYDNKLCTGDEAAESLTSLSNSMRSIGYEIVTGRGDPIKKI